MIQSLPLLRLATSTAEVGNWQRFLNDQGMLDQFSKPLKVDESFGPKTAFATMHYQTARNLMSTGVVDELTRKRAIADGFIAFIQARNADVYYPGEQTPRLIVIHTMENAEKPYSAENVALWFGGRAASPAPMASAHYCVDEDSVVQCVRDTDRAWHAGPVNGRSIGVEHAGYAKQTVVDWFDKPSQAILWRSARLTARLCKKFEIPVVMVKLEDIATSKAEGFCGHVHVTQAYGHKGGHWDPGPNFPYEHYLELVRSA